MCQLVRTWSGVTGGPSDVSGAVSDRHRWAVVTQYLSEVVRHLWSPGR